ncbi:MULTISPECIES: DUF6731 family protein [unclassified Marinobacter]|jgi:hypothetical protein|uniref:DUF6731 family protein n=1 Tax=unclassified Marinobacter TaxID=83889 RepID=UPI0020102E40|nr:MULTISPECIES: DUF6731 family protein [unclassified Marinobacter]MCL1476761.1 hypothetical protein [Marinobacter sp.]MCL1488078.1 hypothetical protein [Marinobacter sp.]UQG57287.1 hypothetical protein MIH16_06495 [Marinobacter sp. M4C]UQG66091.1 hypothetical protein MIH17_06495 [Marinobacter sp. M2C]UQG70371.1 hypothetical protein MIH19_06490 [Marinobacter sp. M1C]
MLPEGQKKITIGFFVSNVAVDSVFELGSFFKKYVGTTSGPAWSEGKYLFEIRDVEQLADGNTIRGVFAKFRSDQIPHAGQAGGKERELDLTQDEGLIEKNHFNFRLSDSLLIFEQNGHGSRPAKLARYISDIAGETLTFDPVLQRDVVDRLMKPGANLTALKVTFARPTNPDMYPDDDWSKGLLDQLSTAGGSSVGLSITSDSRSGDKEKRALADRMKKAATAFMRSGYARSLKVNVEENGIEHPIDLIADRILSVQNVSMAGKYPMKESIYAALNSAFEGERDTVYEVIGQPGVRIK